MEKNKGAVGFIGAGKVGTAFGKYIKYKGYSLYGYYSRTIKSAEAAASYTESKPVVTLEELVEKSDIIFITTADKDISVVCRQIVEKNIECSNKTFVHMSGAMTSEELAPLMGMNTDVFSMHPLQSFAEVEKSVRDLESTVFTLEGDLEKADILRDMLCDLNNRYFEINKSQKTIYHAAACIMSNFLVTLADYGLSLYDIIGIDRRKAFDAVQPLIWSTLENIRELGTVNALTGPIARGDWETVENHIRAIEREDSLDGALYAELTLATAKIADAGKNTSMSYMKTMKIIDAVTGQHS